MLKNTILKTKETYSGEDLVGYIIECPACGYGHVFDKRWTFNGDFEKPTFAPSMLVNKDVHDESNPRCHSFVREGKIQFLSDCTHNMVNMTVDLPEV